MKSTTGDLKRLTASHMHSVTTQCQTVPRSWPGTALPLSDSALILEYSLSTSSWVTYFRAISRSVVVPSLFSSLLFPREATLNTQKLRLSTLAQLVRPYLLTNPYLLTTMPSPHPAPSATIHVFPSSAILSSSSMQGWSITARGGMYSMP